MNGAKYNYEDYEWEPESDEAKIAYYVADTPVPAQEAPLSSNIVPAPSQGVLSRPVGELIASARESLNDTVLAKPVGELIASARESLNDTVLAKPVGELIASARESLNDTVLTKPVGELLTSARESGVQNRRLAH